VHEELTRLAFGCPTGREELVDREDCARLDAGFGSEFVLYGVRWNDLPPFRLEGDEGRGCTKLGGIGSACRVDQTVRFSTQPDCWLCLFRDAKRRVTSGAAIRGCDGAARAAGARVVNGNLMTRSHFGDLQFLHAMAAADNAAAPQTRDEIVDWLRFAWSVAIRDLGPEVPLRTVDIPTVRARFGCSGWTVSDLYILGSKDRLLRFLDEVALGSALHTVQDSFAHGHVEREAPVPGARCSSAVPFSKPGPVVEFHSYRGQDGQLHDEADTRHAMVEQTMRAQSTVPYADVIEASMTLVDLWRRRAMWSEVKTYIDCVFGLSDHTRDSSPGTFK